MLERLGFEKVAQRSGSSHEKYRHQCFIGRCRNVTLDCHHAPFSDSLVKLMSTQMGLSSREFLQACFDDWKPV